MSKHTPYTLVVLLFILFTACGSKKESSASIIAENYALAIVDSVQVSLLTSGLSLVDVHDDNGNLLAIQSDPPKAYVISPEGKILSTMDHPGQDPQAVGNYILSGEFYEDGIALMGQMRLKTYDSNFNLRKSLRPNYDQSGMIYMGFNHLFEFNGPQHKQLVAFFGGAQTTYHSSKPEYYDEFNLVDVVDPYLAGESMGLEGSADKVIFKPFGEFTADSRYKKGKAFYFLRPLFDVKNDQLIYTIGNDTSLYKRSLPDGEIIEAYSIPFDKFILFDGYTMGPAGFKEQGKPGDRSGRIEKVYHVDGFDIIVYNSGMKMSEVNLLDKTAPDFRDQLRKVDYTKHLILQNGMRVNKELRLPEKVYYFDMSDNQGNLWAHKDVSDLEEEPDFVTFYKLRIVPSED